MIVLRLTRSWFNNEDLRLTDELLKELPGILWWAIGGWQKLQESGRLLQPESGAELVGEMEELASPISMFLHDQCELGPDFTIARKDLFEAYKSWSEENGRRFAEDTAGFGRSLRAALPSLKTRKPRVDGKFVRHYTGIGLPIIGF